MLGRKEPEDDGSRVTPIEGCVIDKFDGERRLLAAIKAKRDELRALLDEAVSRAIFAEAEARSETVAEVNRQSAEILKLMAENLSRSH